MTSFRVDAFPQQYPNPLERLNVYDGLIMNAERWEVSQSYFRQRQNVHFQAVNQPGIVCGLGIEVLEKSPSWCRTKTKVQDEKNGEKRWLKIQPGIAVDVLGNPIIVEAGDERDRHFRIATVAPTSGSLTVHIVARYVEPSISSTNGNGDKNGTYQVTIPERYRIEERTDFPDALDVELCRILLKPGAVKLEKPRNVFSPTAGELDFRYRQHVRAKPTAIIRIGISEKLPKTRQNFAYLSHALKGLKPDMQLEIIRVSMDSPSLFQGLDALCITVGELQSLLQNNPKYLKSNFIDLGGTVIVEPEPSARLDSLPFRQNILSQLKSWNDISPSHPLKTDPFLFTLAPKIESRSINLAIADSLIFLGNDLSSAWGVYRSLSRNDIRTAHEMGTNILQYIWQRRYFSRLCHWSNDNRA